MGFNANRARLDGHADTFSDMGQLHDPDSQVAPCRFDRKVILPTSKSRMVFMFVWDILEHQDSFPDSPFTCPLATCRAGFTKPLHFINHFLDCPGFSEGQFICKHCNIVHRFPCKDKDWKDWDKGRFGKEGPLRSLSHKCSGRFSNTMKSLRSPSSPKAGFNQFNQPLAQASTESIYSYDYGKCEKDSVEVSQAPDKVPIKVQFHEPDLHEPDIQEMPQGEWVSEMPNYDWLSEMMDMPLVELPAYGPALIDANTPRVVAAPNAGPSAIQEQSPTTPDTPYSPELLVGAPATGVPRVFRPAVRNSHGTLNDVSLMPRAMHVDQRPKLASLDVGSPGLRVAHPLTQIWNGSPPRLLRPDNGTSSVVGNVPVRSHNNDTGDYDNQHGMYMEPLSLGRHEQVGYSPKASDMSRNPDSGHTRNVSDSSINPHSDLDAFPELVNYLPPTQLTKAALTVSPTELEFRKGEPETYSFQGQRSFSLHASRHATSIPIDPALAGNTESWPLIGTFPGCHVPPHLLQQPQPGYHDYSSARDSPSESPQSSKDSYTTVEPTSPNTTCCCGGGSVCNVTQHAPDSAAKAIVVHDSPAELTSSLIRSTPPSQYPTQDSNEEEEEEKGNDDDDDDDDDDENEDGAADDYHCVFPGCRYVPRGDGARRKKRNLVRHVKVHDPNRKLFPCAFCGRLCSRPDNCKTHEKTHQRGRLAADRSGSVSDAASDAAAKRSAAYEEDPDEARDLAAKRLRREGHVYSGAEDF